MVSIRYSMDSLPPISSLVSSDDSPQKSASAMQKELTHKLHEAKRLKDTYYENWKKFETRCSQLEEENRLIKSKLEKLDPDKKTLKPKEKDANEESASVVYAVNTLSKEVSKITKTFAEQEKLFKKCINDLETNLDTSQKIKEKVHDYIESCKTNELLKEKMKSLGENDKESFSDYLKTGNSSHRNSLIGPSLYDEIKDFEFFTHPQQTASPDIIYEENVSNVITTREIIEKKYIQPKRSCRLTLLNLYHSKDFILKRALADSIFVVNL